MLANSQLFPFGRALKKLLLHISCKIDDLANNCVLSAFIHLNGKLIAVWCTYFSPPRLRLPHCLWSRVIHQHHQDCLKALLPTASAASSHASRKAAPSRFRPLQRPKQKCPSNSRCLSRRSRRWWLRLTQSQSGLQGEPHTILFLSQYNHVDIADKTPWQ